MIGLPRVHHRATDSTNARARELAAAGAPHGTLVTAGEQTAGRGRQGRRWLARAPAAIKWPNDVWIERRKVAGILVEGRPQEGWAVLGVGLNVAAREFPD